MGRRHSHREPPVSFFSFQDIITTVSGIMILLVLFMAMKIVVKKDVAAPHDAGPDANGPPVDLVSLRAQVEKLRQAFDAVYSGALTSRSPDRVAEVRVVWEEEQKAKQLSDEIVSAQRKLHALTASLAALQRSNETAQVARDNAERTVKNLRATVQKTGEDRRVVYVPDRGTTKSPILVECSANRVRCGRVGSEADVAVFPTDAKGIQSFGAYASSRRKTGEYFVFLIKAAGAEAGFGLMEIVKRLGFDVGYDALEEEYEVNYEGVKE